MQGNVLLGSYHFQLPAQFGRHSDIEGHPAIRVTGAVTGLQDGHVHADTLASVIRLTSSAALFGPLSSPSMASADEYAWFPSVNRADLRRQVHQGRVYVWPPGDRNAQRYLSVTSALQATPKDALIRWAAKSVAEIAVNSYELLGKIADNDKEKAIAWLKGAPWAERNKAGLAGTTLHEIVEWWLSDEPQYADSLIRTLSPENQRKAAQLRAFFDQVPLDIVDVEAVVYNENIGYAGTIDLIATITTPNILQRFGSAKPLTLILDVKSGKGIYPETALQLTAYRHATHILNLQTGERDEMTATDGGAVIHVTEGGWSLIPVATDDEQFDTFVDIFHLAEHLPLPDEIVGLPIMRGKA